MDKYLFPGCDEAVPAEIAAEISAWLMVSGDMDDFIYYGDESKRHSEK